jgi:Bacteriophage P22, NinX
MSGVHEQTMLKQMQDLALGNARAEYSARRGANPKSNDAIAAELAALRLGRQDLFVTPAPDDSRLDVNQIAGVRLDYLTAIAIGLPGDIVDGRCVVAASGKAKLEDGGLPGSENRSFNPSADWTVCGPLLGIYPIKIYRVVGEIWATVEGSAHDGRGGQSVRLAVCRALVAHKLADSEGFIPNYDLAMKQV